MSCCKKTTDTKECCEPSSCNTYKQTASSCCDKSSCNSFDVKTEVQKRYGEVAVSDISKLEEAKLVANSFGYSREELASIPEAANMGLSCGNPLAIAGLKQGDVVVDLGSGGGLDCFLAASKVGPDGKVVGIDMTSQMIELANKNKAKSDQYKNVEFKLGEITNMPLPDNFADVVISNCVINLVEDKRKAYQEIFRVLKPGGRVAISDIVLKKEIPEKYKQIVAAYTGCITGAISIEANERYLKESGFKYVDIVDSKADLNAYALLESPGCCGSVAKGNDHDQFKELLSTTNVNDYAASVKIFALKN